MRGIRALATFLLALAPATGWAAFARVEIVPSAPAPIAPSAAVGAAAAIGSPSLTAAAAPLPALAPAFAAPYLAPQPQAAPVPAAAPLALVPAAAAAPARATPATQDPVSSALRESARSILTAIAPRADAGRSFDGASPDAPDFDALSPVRVPAAPARWTPSSALLKPVAAAVNAFNAASHARRLANPRAGERVTTEEYSLRDTLTDLHAAVAGGRYQKAIDAVRDYFQTRAAASWYMENPGYAPYRAQAFAYMRFAERAVLASYGRAFRRASDAQLVAEARDAAFSGRILGHAWRPTAIQEKDSSFCVQNSLFNAISASVGFARPTTVDDFVAASRAALNREARIDRPASGPELAALTRDFGVDFGRRDVNDGMGTRSLAEWTESLGLTLTPAAAPRGDAGWSSLFAPGREILLSLRMFHPRYKHSEDLRAIRGHDFMVLHHEVYLLGAFDSPSQGTRFYLLQDSGSGRTLLATAQELDALTQEVQLLSVSRPVAVPRTR